MFVINQAEEPITSSAPRLTVRTIELDQAVVIRTAGRLQFRREVALFRAQAEKALERGKELVLDFSDLESIDSAGIGELVLIHMRGRARSCEVAIIHPTKRVRELLELTNVASLFRISDGRDPALAGPARPRL